MQPFLELEVTYELVQVAFHNLKMVFHNQQKRILISCFQEIGVAFWHSFSSSRVKETFSLPQSESELKLQSLFYWNQRNRKTVRWLDGN